jgi:capsular exopolysaccharide synthesis family protein
MSRIQNILDKAEREGVIRHVHPFPEAAVGAIVDDGPPAFVTPQTPVVLDAAPPPLLATPARVVSNARLNQRLLKATEEGGTAAEQYRALRTRILHADAGGAVNVVLVTSPGRGEGRSLTVANLGLTMAQERQRRICVVDADLRHPKQAQLFGLPAAPGLADVLSGDAALADALVAIEELRITILPAGTPSGHPAELLGTTAMRRTIDALRSQFDCVLIDAPAAIPLADVGILTPLVDSVLMIVRAGVTSKPAIHDAIASLQDAKLLGIVLNEAA